jgi:hypothetical protein
MPAPADEIDQILRVLVHISARDRSRVGRELALRPESRLKPGCHRRRESAPRGVWRGLLVLTAGLVQYFYGRYLTGPVASSLCD